MTDIGSLGSGSNFKKENNDFEMARTLKINGT